MSVSEAATYDPVSKEWIRPACGKCGNEKDWRDCYNCGGEGYSYHECGEDVCCCLNPQDNVVCDICDGQEGWYQCGICHPWDD